MCIIKKKSGETAVRALHEKFGLAKYFGHSLGHGVGLDIHENPRLSCKSMGVLEPGMVVTVEPAVYVPNQFGIRVEDMVLVTSQGLSEICIFQWKCNLPYTKLNFSSHDSPRNRILLLNFMHF